MFFGWFRDCFFYGSKKIILLTFFFLSKKMFFGWFLWFFLWDLKICFLTFYFSMFLLLFISVPNEQTREKGQDERPNVTTKFIPGFFFFLPQK